MMVDNTSGEHFSRGADSGIGGGGKAAETYRKEGREGLATALVLLTDDLKCCARSNLSAPAVEEGERDGERMELGRGQNGNWRKRERARRSGLLVFEFLGVVERVRWVWAGKFRAG